MLTIKHFDPLAAGSPARFADGPQAPLPTFEQSPAIRCDASRRARPSRRKYDIRVVDQFYAYCQAVARAQRLRDEAHAHARLVIQRRFWIALAAGSILLHHLLDRVAQALSLL